MEGKVWRMRSIPNVIAELNELIDVYGIKEINIAEGVRYKRYHYAGRGRVRPYVRRTSHIYVTVADKNHEGKELASIKVDTGMKTEKDKKIESKGKEASK